MDAAPDQNHGHQTEGRTRLLTDSSCAEHSKNSLACATAHGENKQVVCAQLFRTYTECRKAEQKEIVRLRILNRKGLFWD
mmetsp:Transcript_22001/g.35653  ORF Transcript_22001/g.35653 Transcript_22001/m.35653 type:complete len:80 (-) Transcript_22001:179-418(-)